MSGNTSRQSSSSFLSGHLPWDQSKASQLPSPYHPSDSPLSSHILPIQVFCPSSFFPIPFTRQGSCKCRSFVFLPVYSCFFPSSFSSCCFLLSSPSLSFFFFISCSGSFNGPWNLWCLAQRYACLNFWWWMRCLAVCSHLSTTKERFLG